MGLDMYLNAKKYFSGYEYQKEASPEKYKEYQKLMKFAGVDVITDSPHGYIEVNVGYWRKANQIHGWFVRELADGVDDCKPIYVSRERLAQLRDVVIAEYQNKEKNMVPEPVMAGGSYAINMEGKNPFEIIADIMKTERHNAEFNDENDTDPLRPTMGAFFGGNVKDEWYYKDLEHTLSIINNALQMPKEWDFEYQASW